jgi:hypothetical protein
MSFSFSFTKSDSRRAEKVLVGGGGVGASSREKRWGKG